MSDEFEQKSQVLANKIRTLIDEDLEPQAIKMFAIQIAFVDMVLNNECDCKQCRLLTSHIERIFTKDDRAWN